MEKKSVRKEVKTYFVIPSSCENEDQVNDSMKMAFQEVVEAEYTDPKWITEAEYTNINFTKNTVIVLQEFAGDIFQKLRSTKSVVCGPMCIRSCVADRLPIPENKSPVFTTAMRDVIITASQISPEAKASMKEKVGFMGGVYTNNLITSVTHLVTNAVRSTKYLIASERGIPVMTVDWVEAAWQQSQQRNIKATDNEFITKYKCPVFLNFFVTCSNMPKREKEEIKKLVSENGGTFTAQLRQNETTLLVISEPRGEKYKHARSWGLPCVRPLYIHDSVKRGFALGEDGYLIEPAVSCSTPTKGDDAPNFTYNSEALSMINMDTSKSRIDDTQITNCSVASSLQPRAAGRSSGREYATTVEGLTVSDAKKAGSFLDGCRIFLSGFSATESEKLRRIVSLGGATVFSELTERVSHVLVGEFLVQDMKTFSALAQKPHIVSVDWLVDSIKSKCPSNEEAYYCLETRRSEPEPPSPLSQKGMQLLQPPADLNETSKMPPPTEPPVSRKLFSEFVKENAGSPMKLKVSSAEAHVSNSTMSSDSSTIREIFFGQKLVVAGFPPAGTAEIESAVRQLGGTVVAANYTGVADYAIVPVQAEVLNITALEVVTSLWLEDCMDCGELLPIQYYHQPVTVVGGRNPLAGCVVTLSSYTGKEKAFLIELTQLLGATYQEVFARVSKQDKGVLASTHLVCPKAEGQKYKAAERWGLPAVTREWLLGCARQGSQLDEDVFRVNNCTVTDKITEMNTKTELTPSTAPVPTSLKTPVVDTDRASTPSAPVTALLTPPCFEPIIPAPVPAHTPAQHKAINSLKRKSSAQTPDEASPFHVATPDTPYGQVFETPSAETKKRWKRFIDDFPCKAKSPPRSQKTSRRQSTPLSELKRRIWAKALETSQNNVLTNFSIEDMAEENNPEDESGQPMPMRAQGDFLKQTPLRGTTSALNTSLSNSGLDSENIHPRRVMAGRSTPTVGDFKTARVTPNTRSQPKLEDTPQSVKKSPANEMVSEMLGQLHRRLSTPSGAAEEPQPLPQRELISTNQLSEPTKPVVTSLLPESQPVLIGWEDPVESAERAKVMNSPMPSTSDVPVVKPRKFVLSNVKEKERYEELLLSIGETVITASSYDNTTTHLIIDTPLRSEKLLCCLAAGKWVLHTSYIDHMVSHQQYMPDEERFEWGNPASTENIPALSQGSSSSLEQQRLLAAAAVQWRRKLNGSGGAFSGMRAVLLARGEKYDSYQRLICAGGGEIIPATSILQATHCFVEASKVSTVPVALAQLVKAGVPCLAPVFLGEMLTKHPSPSVKDGLIPEYRRLIVAKQIYEDHIGRKERLFSTPFAGPSPPRLHVCQLTSLPASL